MSSVIGSLAPPLVVVEGPPNAIRRPLRASLAALRADGWTVVRGWAAPLGGERVVCTGTVATADDARRALLAAISGAGLVLAAIADRETIDRFLDDLRRVAPVEHRDATRSPGNQTGRLLSNEQRSLLTLLGEGLSVRDAAASLGLTRHAADRRLAAARATLGVDSTAGAVVAALGAGIDQRSHHGAHVRPAQWRGNAAPARADAAGDRGRGRP